MSKSDKPEKGLIHKIIKYRESMTKPKPKPSKCDAEIKAKKPSEIRSMNPSTIFTDPSWKFSDVVFPNLLAWKEDRDGNIIIIAVVALRLVNRRGVDFALGKAGLERVLNAEPPIPEAYVVVGKQLDGGRREFIAAEKATVVHNRLNGYAPQDGKFGPFYWIT